MPLTTNMTTLVLATVEDAHNQGAFVCLVGGTERVRALYDANLQSNGVVIRTCHLVVVDTARDPWQIVWRIGTCATIRALDDQTLTLDLGYRLLIIPRCDNRPEDEQRIPLTVGNEVLLRGHLEDDATIVDTITNGAPAHPERFQAYLTAANTNH